MLLILRLLTLTALLVLFYQDTKSRSISVFLFPLLIIVFIIQKLFFPTGFITWQPVLVNICFLSFQLLLVSLYFSVKQKQLVNITNSLLGWGDVLFLLSITCYLSMLNYLLFYIVSLILILVLWVCYLNKSERKEKHIPLAGLQALALMMVLITDWFLFHFDVTSDDWILKWIAW